MERLILTRPTRSSRITQRFGQNRACLTQSGKIVPKRSNGSCPAHSKDYYRSIRMEGHNGHDVATWRGEAVVHCATFSGWLRSEKDQAGGIGVDVVSNEPLFFPEDVVSQHDAKYLEPVTYKGVPGFKSYVKIRYWHLLTPIGWDEKPVDYGMLVGLADNTGASSGDHLHWAPKWCDKNGGNIARYNGYTGAFDPEPFYTHDVYAGDSVGHIGGEASPLSYQERKEILSNLSVMQFFLLQLREFIHKHL